MDSNHAHLACVLKVDQRCDACKRHTMEVLGSIDGVYSVSVDAESKTVRIMGEVDPNYCVRALGRCGIHAELVRADITHPRMMAGSRSLYDNSDCYDSYNRNFYDPYAPTYRRSLSEGMWQDGYHQHHHEYPMRSVLPEYSYNSSPFYNGPTQVPSYNSYPQTMDYYPYDEHVNSCTIV